MESSKPTSSKKSMTAGLTIAGIVGTILGILFHAGAAKLSYDRYGSIGWAILAFIFGSVYYPYYAFFVSGSSPATVLGGMRKMKW